MQRKFLTAAELAQRWPITENTLGQWRHQDKKNAAAIKLDPSKRQGPVFYKLGGKPVYYLEDIEAYERERKF